MLYHLLVPLAENFGALNVFRYITFRVAGATLTALFLCFVLGPLVIRLLSRLRAGQPIRVVGPDHRHKAGTPTMGGLLILLSLSVSVLLWADLTNRALWTVLLLTLAYGVLGFYDDYRKIRNNDNSAGLSVRAKLFWQTLIALGAGVAILLDPGFDAEMQFPFFKELTPHIGAWYLPLAVLLIVFISNSVNLTDGLDGLAIGPAMIAAGTFVGLSYAAGHAQIADYLAVKAVAGSGQLAILCGALVGSGLGFLWFNTSPAQLFMGDVGALALGGALATVAVLIHQEILLLWVGGIFVLEALTVIIQVFSFRLTGRRVFLMAPIHHHFEKLGWAEQKIVVRFWILSIILTLFALTTLKIR